VVLLTAALRFSGFLASRERTSPPARRTRGRVMYGGTTGLSSGIRSTGYACCSVGPNSPRSLANLRGGAPLRGRLRGGSQGAGAIPGSGAGRGRGGPEQQLAGPLELRSGALDPLALEGLHAGPFDHE